MGDGRDAVRALPPRVVEADDDRVLATRPLRRRAWRRARADPAPRHAGPLADHPWRAQGEVRTAARRVLGRLRFFRSPGGIACAVMLIGFAIAGSLTPFLGAILAAPAVTWLLYTNFRIRGMGDTEVRFLEFPYRPDGPLVVRFGVDDAGGHFMSLRADLECIAERLVRSAFWRRRRCLRVHGDTQIRREGDLLPEPGSGIDLTFDLPPGLPGTELAKGFPVYWQLRIRGATTGGPYDETFLLPVYAEAATRE